VLASLQPSKEELLMVTDSSLSNNITGVLKTAIPENKQPSIIIVRTLDKNKPPSKASYTLSVLIQL